MKFLCTLACKPHRNLRQLINIFIMRRACWNQEHSQKLSQLKQNLIKSLGQCREKTKKHQSYHIHKASQTRNTALECADSVYFKTVQPVTRLQHTVIVRGRHTTLAHSENVLHFHVSHCYKHCITQIWILKSPVSLVCWEIPRVRLAQKSNESAYTADEDLIQLSMIQTDWDLEAVGDVEPKIEYKMPTKLSGRVLNLLVTSQAARGTIDESQRFSA